MARGRKKTPLTIDEEILYLEKEILNKEDELQHLKERLNNAMETKKKEEMNTIYKLMIESGKNFEDIKQLIMTN